MEILTAAERLAALGHEARLAIFRLLVQAGPAGLSAGAIGEAVGMAPNALSFHLSHLSRVGLIEGRRESRFIHYTARFAAMGDLIGFLTDNCCQGEPCLTGAAAAPAAAEPSAAAAMAAPPGAPSAGAEGIAARPQATGRDKTGAAPARRTTAAQAPAARLPECDCEPAILPSLSIRQKS